MKVGVFAVLFEGVEFELWTTSNPWAAMRWRFVDTDFLEHRDSCASMQYPGIGVIRDSSHRGHWLSIGSGTCV